MKFWPSVLANVRFTLRTGSVTAAQPVNGLELDVAGGIGAGHVEVVLPSFAGRVTLLGSPPPPTRPRLVIELGALAATLTLIVMVAVAPTAMAVVLVQTMLGGVETQANPLGELKLAKLTPVGNTSTTRMVPVLGCEPILPTVNV